MTDDEKEVLVNEWVKKYKALPPDEREKEFVRVMTGLLEVVPPQDRMDFLEKVKRDADKLLAGRRRH